jgi:phage terminase Nu1 subunit (DNA packaging protein)
MAIKPSTASKLKLKVRMSLWQYVPSLEGIPTRCERGIPELKTANVEGVKTRSFVGG